MKIRKIRFKNLNSLRLEKEIDFEGQPLSSTGLFAIVGDTGAGKSTLLDAITLAMYGRIHRNKDVKEVLSYGSTDCFAEAEFEINATCYLAQWSIWKARKKLDGNILGPNRKLSKWDEKKKEFVGIAEKIREVEATMEEVTGLDYDRFCRSVLLSQGDFAAFLKASERERSELLERITGTEIYSEISKAAFARHRLEEGKLNKLQTELDTLRLLSKVEVKELKALLNEKKAEGTLVKTQLEALRVQFSWRQKLLDLATKKSVLQKKVEQLVVEKNERQEDWEKLEQHHKTLPFHTDLARLNDKKQNIIQLQGQIKKLEISILEYQKKQESTQVNFEEIKTTLQNYQTKYQKAQQLFEAVNALDVLIKEKAEPLKKRVSEVQDWQKHLKKTQTELTLLSKQKKQLQTNIEQSQKWLEANQVLKSLTKDLPTIEIYRRELGQIFNRKKILDEEKIKLEKKQKNCNQKALATQKQFTKAQTELAVLQEAFEVAKPLEYSASRSELLTLLTKEIEQLAEERKNLVQLQTFNQTYQSMLLELSNYEERLQNLKAEEFALSSELLNSMLQKEEWEQQEEFKKQVYEQQRLIANYQKDRAELKEGEPCPLCFSEEHPFRAQNWQPFINEAKRELETATKYHKQATAHHRTLLKKQLELIQQIEHLNGDEARQLRGQVSKQLEKMLDCESKMAALLNDTLSEDWAMAHGQKLARLMGDFEHNFINKKAIRDHLAALNAQLEKAEKTIQQKENDWKDAQFRQQQANDNIQHNIHKISELSEKFQTSGTELNQILKKYNYVFEEATAKNMFKDLEKKEGLFEAQQATLASTQKSLELTTQKITLKEQANEDLSLQIEKRQLELDAEKKQLEALQLKRQDLFGNKNPTVEGTKMRKQVATLEREKEQASQQFENVKINLQSTKNALTHQQEQLTHTKSETTQLEDNLIAQIAETGFESLLTLRAAILPKMQASDLESAKQKLAQRLVETNQSLKNVTEDITVETQKAITEKSLDEVAEVLTTQEATFQELLQVIGALQEKLEDHNIRKKESTNLLQQIDNQRKEFNRWATLNDLIGSADGKKFRVFAQGLTLKKLVQLANKHLKSLNERYHIFKRSDQDLELDIIDTFQADNRRSMHTLSGGESFLVSLSLALGLSDLAGRNANIRSLFIDEGFGTLDENTLDLAISTLENLQARGKTIGVISHVKELKERISTQIQIVKRGSGFSEIEVRG